MDLATMRTELRLALADGDNVAGWTTATLDEAIRQGLASYTLLGPPREESLTVEMDGTDQWLEDLTSFGPSRWLAFAYPWVDGASRFADCAVAWRLSGSVQIQFESPLAAGETLRVRYMPRYSTSQWPEDLDTLMLANQHHAYLLRSRQLARRPSSPPGDVEQCNLLANRYWVHFLGAVSYVYGGTNPVWDRVGL